MSFSLSRRVRILILSFVALLVLAVLLLAAFPVAWLKDIVEDRLSARFDSRVQIASIDRESRFSLSPTLRVANVRIAQPAWAGRGDLAAIRELRVRVKLLPLFVGRVDAQVLSARGVRLSLIRDANRRENWRKDKPRGGGGPRSGMELVRVEDAVIRYSDAVQRRSATLSVTIHPTSGLTATGTGMVDGAPVDLAIRGGAMTADRPWPFDARITGPALTMHARGEMAGPLRSDDMQFQVTARADDLKRIDHVIEAGLFMTQPVTLRASVRHQDDTWTIEKLSGTIGSSSLAGRITAHKADGRTNLDGDVRFARLNFADLASDQGIAKAIATARTEGLRLVPGTRINIRKIDKTDGRIAVRVDRVIGNRGPSPITNVSAVLTLDDRVLTVEPLRMGLNEGAITGRMIVDQRDGGPKPRVTLALALTDSNLSALAGGGKVDGRVDARVNLTGVGNTIREAVGTSNGSIGIVARSGTLPEKLAAMIGFDIGRAVLGSDQEKAALRCAAIRLTMRNGLGHVDTLLVDTSISQTRGTGTVRFPAEALALSFTGAPKRDAPLRLPGAVRANGSIREPHIILPEKIKSAGSIFKIIGNAIAGKNGPAATDADCTALTRRTLAG